MRPATTWTISPPIWTERLTITAATDTTDAVMESDEALRLRAQAAFEG
jgi:phage-related baseplate assembly protein